MGLDMYLNRMPRYKKATASDVSAIENYLDWQKAKKRRQQVCKLYTERVVWH